VKIISSVFRTSAVTGLKTECLYSGAASLILFIKGNVVSIFLLFCTLLTLSGLRLENSFYFGVTYKTVAYLHGHRDTYVGNA
jgi:hypothetical protein